MFRTGRKRTVDPRRSKCTETTSWPWKSETLATGKFLWRASALGASNVMRHWGQTALRFVAESWASR